LPLPGFFDTEIRLMLAALPREDKNIRSFGERNESIS